MLSLLSLALPIEVSHTVKLLPYNYSFTDVGEADASFAKVPCFLPRAHPATQWLLLGDLTPSIAGPDSTADGIVSNPGRRALHYPSEEIVGIGRRMRTCLSIPSQLVVALPLYTAFT